ncbi:MAG: T9SS type A sorting domain-containing protein [Chitinophagales bacterium]
MKKSDTKIKSNKLAAYSALAGGFLFSGLQAQAQLVYTDIDPDETIGIGDNYELDLNDDGNTDFEFIINTFTIPSFFYTTGTGGLMFDAIIPRMLVYPDGGNSVNASTIAGSASTFAYPYAMNNGDIVDDDLNFKSNSLQFLGLYLSVADYPSAGDVYPFANYGNWPNKSNKFMGLKFEVDGETHFGWVRLSMSDLEITIDDYAFDATPETAIETGVTVSVSNVIPADKIKAYSFGNTVNIITNNLQAETATVKITNAIGEVVFADNLDLTGMQVKLDNAASGVYMLQVVADGAVFNKELFISR